MYLCRTCQQQAYESGETYYCPHCDSIGVLVDEVGADYENRFGYNSANETMPNGEGDDFATRFRRVIDTL